MEISTSVLHAFDFATEYGNTHKLEYITPEVLLVAIIIENNDFRDAFKDCGGNIGRLLTDLYGYIESIEKSNGDKIPDASLGLNEVLDVAGQSAYGSGAGEVGIRHIIRGIFSLTESHAVYFMSKQGVTEAELLSTLTRIDDEDWKELQALDELAELEEMEEFADFDLEEDTTPYFSFAPCLNDTLKNNNPLIGRKDELDRTIHILCRKDKNNPLHIGEPGVGKTAITYGLVERIKKGDVPDILKGAKVFALDLGGLIAGTQFRGDFEKRVKRLLSSIETEEKPIVYIDEIHNLSGAGAAGESSFDAGNMLKPYLSDGHIRFIGATTFEEYKRYFEKNKSLVRRFQTVEIVEPSISETVEILKGLKTNYEKFHGVKYGKDILKYIAEMSAKHINERFLPDKAIDLMDEAGAYRKLNPTGKKTNTVDKSVINMVLTKICRVSIESVETEELKSLATLEGRIKSGIFGQDEAISEVVNAVKYSKAGLLDEDKPLGSLLFVGPTGVGKTEIAKCLSKELGIKLIRFDMSEYGEKHALSKLIGSPAGYVGYEDGGLLTDAIRKTPQAVLLLDEIEKAHPDIYNVLLQIMDYATLTDNQGRKADFRNVILIMTSNAGANLVGKNGIGFASENQDKGAILDAVKNTFQPEFRNRLNKTVVFNGMDDNMAALVVDKKLKELKDQLHLKGVKITADKKAKNLIIKRGISKEFGAREVDRVVRNDVKSILVDELLFGKLKKGGSVKLSVKDGEFIIS